MRQKINMLKKKLQRESILTTALFDTASDLSCCDQLERRRGLYSL